MTLPFYPFYWGDYSAKTFDLTQTQHGAYMLFLRHVYCTGTGIADGQRYSIAKALSLAEMESADYVLGRYFKKENESWVHERAFEVMSEWQVKHEAHVRAGKKKKKTGLSPPQATRTLTNRKLKIKNLEEEKKEHFVAENSAEWSVWKKYRGVLNARDIRLPDGKLVRGSFFPSPLPPEPVNGVPFQ